jgi:hypothetical protein
VCVRAKELTPGALIAAMEAGDFYASTGVELSDVKYDSATGTLTLQIVPQGREHFMTEFVGTLVDAGTADVGTVLASVQGQTATYRLTGRELYVRARVTSDRDAERPSLVGQKKQAWTQPVGWERHLRSEGLGSSGRP